MPYRIDVAKMTPEPRRVEIPKHRQIGGSERVKDGDGKDQARADEGRHSGAHKNCRQRKSSENKQKLVHLKNKEKR